MPGVTGVFDHSDLRGRNRFGVVVQDEVFLAEDEISYRGQPIAVVAGRDRSSVEAACRAVRVLVDEESPILSIDDAIARDSFLTPPLTITRGGPFADVWARSQHQLEGELVLGGQEHFYLETQAALAIPTEGQSITVHAATQNPSGIQAVVAEVLGLPMSAVVCSCSRVGGAFGGKETQAVLPALMAALVAQKTRRPARIVYSRRDDMRFTGKRHRYQVRWKLACNDRGVVDALRMNFYADGGATADLSHAVLERTLLHAENAYFVPNVEMTGRVCRTNLPPNTAFRGFGAPQAVAAIESILEDVAVSLGVDPYALRRANCYGDDERSITPYGQRVRDHLLPEIFERVSQSASYASRKVEIDRFNARSSTHLRGIAITAVKFGISFVQKFLNQANALVNVYIDGTVQVSTGATEMGQGIYTKLQQIVADQFGLELDRVAVMPTSTEKNNNTSPTAASASTDLNGAAAISACGEIRARLAAVAAAHSKVCGEANRIRFQEGFVFDELAPERRISFQELTGCAHRQRVDLGARSFYATPGLDFNHTTGRGNPFRYYTTGAAVSEVMIDRFTGVTRVVRVDLLMDIGNAINPGIDRGQVVGGFVQGLGWVTSEELCYGAEGELLSDGPSKYKLPACTDIPADFRIDFVDNPRHQDNIFRSKGMGEPPLLLAVSAWIAIKNALASLSAGRPVQIRLPATPQEILTAIHRLPP